MNQQNKKKRTVYQSLAIWNDHSNLRWVWSSSSTNFETALYSPRKNVPDGACSGLTGRGLLVLVLWFWEGWGTYTSFRRGAFRLCWVDSSPSSRSAFRYDFETVLHTHQHLLILRNPNPLLLHNLHILQPAQNLMLHDEGSLDTEYGAFLDVEGFVLQRFDGAGAGEVDCDVWAAFDFEG